MGTKYQQRATAIIDAQLEQLRAVLGEVNERLGPATTDLRQIGRTIDELELRRTFNRANALLERQIRQLRERQQALEHEVADLSRAARSIEQLIRQTEMSSAILRDDTPQADPWELALKAQIIQGREDERARLAREVHDGPAQVVAHVVLGLEHSITLAQQGKIDRLLELLRNLRDSSKSALYEVRRFIADLRPPALETKGLDGALRELSERVAASGAITIQCDGAALPRLNPEQEIVLFRIAQEALNNAVKHARNATVNLHFAAVRGQVVLLIRDNGPGFDPRTVAARSNGKHWGLAGMRERAELIGARLTIASAPGSGSEIRVVLPLDAG